MPTFTGPLGPITATQQAAAGVTVDQNGRELIYNALDWVIVDQNGNTSIMADAQFRRQYPGEGAPVPTAQGTNVTPVLAAGSDAQVGQCGATSPGSGPATGAFVTVTYAVPLAAIPRAVIITPANNAAALAQGFVSTSQAGFFNIAIAVAPAINTPLLFNYMVVE